MPLLLYAPTQVNSFRILALSESLSHNEQPTRSIDGQFEQRDEFSDCRTSEQTTTLEHEKARWFIGQERNARGKESIRYPALKPAYKHTQTHRRTDTQTHLHLFAPTHAPTIPRRRHPGRGQMVESISHPPRYKHCLFSCRRFRRRQPHPHLCSLSMRRVGRTTHVANAEQDRYHDPPQHDTPRLSRPAPQNVLGCLQPRLGLSSSPSAAQSVAPIVTVGSWESSNDH